MMLSRSFGLVATTCLFFANVAAAQDCPADEVGTCFDNENTTNDDGVDCGVYMAPSTIGDHSNMGIFTAKSMKNGEKVPFPEIIIPLLWRVFSVSTN